MVRILRSTLMVRVGGGWTALDEFLVKNDPCRGKQQSSKSQTRILLMFCSIFFNEQLRFVVLSSEGSHKPEDQAEVFVPGLVRPRSERKLLQRPGRQQIQLQPQSVQQCLRTQQPSHTQGTHPIW